MGNHDVGGRRARIIATAMPTDPVGAIPRAYNFAADILQRNLAAGRASKPAFIDPRGTWTYGQLADRVDRFGAVLRALGLRREERVLMCLLDTIDWPTAFLGAIKAGIVAVPVNTLMTEDDYRFMLADSRAVLVVSEALLRHSVSLIKECPELAHVMVSGDDARGHLNFEDAIAEAKPEPYTAPTLRDDMCFWLYTSGSTGKPKGAVHIHSDLRLTDDLYAAPILGLNENDVCYSVAKLFFAYGLGNALTFPMSVGASTVLLPDRPTPRRHCRFAEATCGHGVLCGADILCSIPGESAAAEAFGSQTRCCAAGEALPEDIGRRWVIASAWTFSTASARPRCCTSFSPTGRAT